MVRSRTRATWSKKRGPCHGDRLVGEAPPSSMGPKELFHKITLPKTNSLPAEKCCLGKDPFLWGCGLFSRAQRTVVSRRVFTNILSLTNQYNECHKGFWAIQRSYIGIIISRYKNPYEAISTMDCHKGFGTLFQLFFNHMVSFVTVFCLGSYWMDVFFAIGKLQW